MRVVLLFLIVATTAAAAAQDVRVRLFEGRSGSTAQFSSAVADIGVEVDGRWVGEVRSGQSLILERDGGEVEIDGGDLRASGERVRLVSDEPIRLRASRYDRRYEGSFDVRASSRGLHIVNTVPMEPYVASVVAVEYPFREIEGAKAQAVLARTYALRHQGGQADYDLEDSQRSQVYRGLDYATDTSRRAASETAGQVLMYDGEVIEAVYSSSSGGHTADNESVWGTDPVPYLRGRPDPYDRDAPNHSWTTGADADAVHRALSRYARGTTGVRVSRRAASGHTMELTLEPSGRRITGNQFRGALNAALGWRTIRSTHVEVDRSGDRYTFRGRGFGHGVGMSQYGARGQAVAGYSYTDILGFYFQGTHLAGTVGGAMPSAPLASRPDDLRRTPTRRAVAWGLEAAPGDTRVDPTARPDAPAETDASRASDRDERPVWVVTEPLPNGERVRTRPTPRAEARAEAQEQSEPPRRRGW
jgi:stage II sporulation protein D